jgi:hypothetical protein
MADLSSLSLVFFDQDSVEVARIDSLTSSGEFPYPGASVAPRDWPGWMLLDNGTWVYDPSDVNLRNGVWAMIESVPGAYELLAYPESTGSYGSPEAISTPLVDGGLTTGAELPETGPGSSVRRSTLLATLVVALGALSIAAARRSDDSPATRPR